MIKFSRKQEQNLKDRINTIFTLTGTLLFCIYEFMNDSDEVTSLIVKIIFVILFFWFILGRIASKILYSLIKESIEDQTEVEEDLRRRKEIHEFDVIEKSEVRENIQKVKF